MGDHFLPGLAFQVVALHLIGMLLCGVPIAAAETIEGQVLDAATGAGIAGASVDLQSWSVAGQNTVTEGSGSFRFEGVEPGEYRIRFESASYVAAEDTTTIRVLAGHTLKLEVRMVAWATLSGRVVDPHGEPLPHARVRLSGTGFTMGGRAYQRTSWGDAGGVPLTDSPLEMSVEGKAGARGEFTVRVTPGAYQLTALPAAGAPRPRGEDGALLAWQQSTPWRMGVAPGAGVEGLELRVEAVPAFAVRGQVRNPDRTPAAGATVTLEDPSHEYKTVSRPDGTFAFSAVPRGTWCFEASSTSGARALECVAVGPLEVRGFQLDLAAPMPLRVVTMVAPDAASSSPGAVGDAETTPHSDALLLTMTGGPDHPLPARNSHTLFLFGSGTGRYSAKDAYPGRYRLARGIRPAGPAYLAGVLAGDQDLMRDDGDIEPGQVLTLLFRTDSGSVKGRVEHGASGTVILVPRDASRRGRGWSRSTGCDAAGDYEISGIAPGDYAVIALAANDPIPELDESLLQPAKSITIRPGATATVDLQPTNRPVY